MQRRNFIKTMIALASAPAIIPIQNIMPVKQIVKPPAMVRIPLQVTGAPAYWGYNSNMELQIPKFSYFEVPADVFARGDYNEIIKWKDLANG